MESFSKKKKFQETENLRKESLLQQLSYSVKEIQLLVSKKNEVFATNEECNSFITILEAIFLHGLKKGILKTALKTVTGEEGAKPQPSFWQTVSSYTHKNTVTAINTLSQIKTDVGRCRVWIRMAINEGELTSYLTAMEKDRKALNRSYSNQAFLRDRETCDTACMLLEGILSATFQIPVNSSILNVWSMEPLILSGAWLPPMKTPLSTGVDIAGKIEDEDDNENDTSSIRTSSSVTSLSIILTLEETQALKMILDAPFKKFNKDVNDVVLPSSCSETNPEVHDFILKEEDGEEVVKVELDIHNEREKSVDSVQDSPLFNDNCSLTDLDVVENGKDTKKSDLANKLQDKEDYNVLLENMEISLARKINYENILKEVMKRQNEKNSVKTNSPGSASENTIYNSYSSKLYKIVREIGLKEQKYTCAGCQLSIGLTFGEAKFCYFTGEYFCEKCHINETSVIPSRLIFNWDHKKYPVCSSAYKYLSDVCSRFLINIKQINPKLYSAVKEMKELREIRVQLNLLRAYFYTCKEPVLEDFQKKLTPREYIYEFIDHYSINDLNQVPNRVLSLELSAIVSYGKNHVFNCLLCSQKGFICEICRNSKAIYAFEVKTTYRCNKCCSLYHSACLSSGRNCPKCKRLRSRTGELTKS